MALASKAVATAQWLVNMAMAANPLGIAIIAIVGLVAGDYILEKRFGLGHCQARACQPIVPYLRGVKVIYIMVST